VLQWRDYKEEYERLSDWLQQIDILVKAHKTSLLATLQEKTKQLEDVKVRSRKTEYRSVDIRIDITVSFPE
jgi:nesprin-1